MDETVLKKMVSRNVAVTLGIICIVLVAGLGVALAFYASIVSDKDNAIASKDNQIASLNLQNSELYDSLAESESAVRHLNESIADWESIDRMQITIVFGWLGWSWIKF